MSQVADWSDVEAMADQAMSNWQQFPSFHWFGARSLEDPERWCLVYTSNRDSGLIAQSNAHVIAEEFEPFLKKGKDIRGESHSHWACGHVDGYAIRVRNKRGHVTKAFQKWCELQARLEDYPLLDEQHHSELVYNATIENIESERKRAVNLIEDDGGEVALPENWANRVFSYLWDHDEQEVQDQDDRGGYPSALAIAHAMDMLNFVSWPPDVRGEPGPDDWWTEDRRTFWQGHPDGVPLVILTTTTERWAEDIMAKGPPPRVWERFGETWLGLDPTTGGYKE